MEQSKSNDLQFFEKYFGNKPAVWCMQLWQTHRFKLVVTKERKTKLGDFSIRKHQAIITVNGNLRPEAFLVTYLHELAHLLTFKRYGNKVAPHGQEWKMCYTALLQEALDAGYFSEKVAPVIIQHIKKPKAATTSDQLLYHTLHADAGAGVITLAQIPDGGYFSFRGKIYRRVALRRTWCTCECWPKGITYRISTVARVSPISIEELQHGVAV